VEFLKVEKEFAMKSKMMGLCLASSVILILGFWLVATPKEPATAKNNSEWPELSFQPIASGLSAPVHVTHAGDGSGRLFVVEQPGRIRFIQNGNVSAPFLDISGRVRSPASGGGTEEGLLSVAFPPGFGATKDYFYVYYTNRDGDNQLSRFYLSSDPDSAEANSEELILLFEHPVFSNHNGGQLAFGPDGYLYIGPGDGGGSGDPRENAQNLGSLLGKLLRIDVEPNTSPPVFGEPQGYLPLVFNHSHGNQNELAYSIPADNPFVGTPGARQEVWAFGLRNPWRFSFDRASGDLYIGDVGQSSWEEVNIQPAASAGGENYGWNIMEGFECYGATACDQSGLTLPVHAYPTRAGGCAITGGHVYRGQAYPNLQGIYFYGDYCSGTIWGLKRDGNNWQNQELASTPYNISSFGEDQAGELYLTDRGGSVYQLGEAP
jgi:glucose/arabinose dehydrogenase